MGTYGDIRFRVSKQLPGVDLPMIDGWLMDRYTQILDRLKWQRTEARAVIQTTAPYSTGTLAVTQGSNAIALTGGTFTPAMTGLSIGIDWRLEHYAFTYVSANTATLDRPFEGPGDALATFAVYQNIYALPSNCRVIGSIDSNLFGPLARFSLARLRDSVGETRVFGPPRLFAPCMDDGSGPPNMQVELLPIPDGAHSLTLTYTAEASAFAGTSTILQAWLRPAALIAGTLSDGYEFLEKYAAADRQKLKYAEYLGDMVRTDSLNRGSQPIQVAPWLTRHNLRRAIRSTQRMGPRLP